jgi:hypothetical protein
MMRSDHDSDERCSDNDSDERGGDEALAHLDRLQDPHAGDGGHGPAGPAQPVWRALSVSHDKTILCGAFARARRACDGPKRRVPARAWASMTMPYQALGWLADALGWLGPGPGSA